MFVIDARCIHEESCINFYSYAINVGNTTKMLFPPFSVEYLQCTHRFFMKIVINDTAWTFPVPNFSPSGSNRDGSNWD